MLKGSKKPTALVPEDEELVCEDVLCIGPIRLCLEDGGKGKSLSGKRMEQNSGMVDTQGLTYAPPFRSRKRAGPRP